MAYKWEEIEENYHKLELIGGTTIYISSNCDGGGGMSAKLDGVAYDSATICMAHDIESCKVLSERWLNGMAAIVKEAE